MSTQAPIGLGSYYPDDYPAQEQADVAVIIPTVLRPTLVDAVRSIYAQDFDGRIQILIGVDVDKGDAEQLAAVLAERPAHVSAIVLSLPFSTAVRNGGLHGSGDGGATRTVLSFMANARYVAFLDDDNTWLPPHLSTLRGAIGDLVWSASQRFLVDGATGERLCVDRWDSVGAHKGRFAANGGLVDTNCLMVDKLKTAPLLWRWSRTLMKSGGGSDRDFFSSIADAPHRYVEEPTVLYSIRESSVFWRFIREQPTF